MPETEFDIGVYLKNVSSSTFFRAAEQRNAGSLFFAIYMPSFDAVSSRFLFLDSSVGRVRSEF